MLKQVRIFVYGDVIGVGFRAWTKYQSKFTNVVGWVRNVGSEVEVLIQGDEKNVLDMIERLKKGPPTSIVKNVEINWEDQKEVFNSFEIKK